MSGSNVSDPDMPDSIAVDYLVYRYDPPRRGGGLSGFTPAESNLPPPEREWWHKSYRHWWEPRGTDIRWGPSVCYLIAQDLNGRDRAILCYRTAGSSVARKGTVSFLLIGSPDELTAAVALALADWSWAAGTSFDPATKPNQHWYVTAGAQQRVPLKTPYVVPAAGDDDYESLLQRIVVDFLEKSDSAQRAHHLLVPGVGPGKAVQLLKNVLAALDNDRCGTLVRRFSFSASQKDNIPADTAPRVVFATQKFTWQGGGLTILDDRPPHPDPDPVYTDAARLLVRVSRRADRHRFDEIVQEAFNPVNSRGWCERLIENSELRQWLGSPEGPSVPRPVPVPVPVPPPLPAAPPPPPLLIRDHVIGVYRKGIHRARQADTVIAVVNILVDMIRDMVWLTERNVVGLRAVSQLKSAPDQDFVLSRFELPRRPDGVDAQLSKRVLQVVDRTFVTIFNGRSDVIRELLGAVNAAAVATDSSYSRPPAEAPELSAVIDDRHDYLTRRDGDSKRAAAAQAREEVRWLCERRILETLGQISQKEPSSSDVIGFLVELIRVGGGLTEQHVETLRWISFHCVRDSPLQISGDVAGDLEACDILLGQVGQHRIRNVFDQQSRALENRAFEDALRTECGRRVQYGREIVQRVISDVTVVGLHDRVVIDRLIAGIRSLAGEPIDPEISQKLEKLRGKADQAFERGRAAVTDRPTEYLPAVGSPRSEEPGSALVVAGPTTPGMKYPDRPPPSQPQNVSDREPGSAARRTWNSNHGEDAHNNRKQGAGVSATDVTPSGRRRRVDFSNPLHVIVIAVIILVVIVFIIFLTVGRSGGGAGIPVRGFDGSSFKKVVFNDGAWQASDVPAVFADAAVDAAQAQSPPGEIRLTISKEWQKKADDVLDAARIDDFGRDSFKPDGAVVVIDPRDGGVRAVATRGQAAGNANLATGLTANPGELAVLLSAAAMDKNGLVGLHPDEAGASGCKDFPAVVQNSCTGSFKALQEQLGAGFLPRAQAIACGLGFNGIGYQVNGVRIAASSALPGESCGGDPAVATDAPIQATPFQLAVAMSAFAARVVARPALCPHFVQPVSVGSCPIEGIPLTADIAQYIRDEMTAGNGNAALMNSWSADNSSSTGWAVGFAPAQNPTVAVAVYIKGRSATNATPAKQAAHDAAKTLLGSAG
ncbi:MULTISPECIES: hypothetical protein [unclassified Frankia]|uniref:hypothetical protein n=1 Tax=unclassified Frankia TaxID=2632575 RepID=UPI002AD20206|nr:MULTISPECIES: hypothetical protein [unclassified Frankia]